MKTIKYILLLVSMAGFFSCSFDENDVVPATPNTFVTFGHFTPGYGRVDLLLGNTNTVIGINNFAATVERTPTSGNRLIRFRQVVNSDTLEIVNSEPMLEPYGQYTGLLAYVDGSTTNVNSAVGLMLLKDNLMMDDTINSKVRFVHLGVGAPAVDIYVFPTGGTATTPTFSNVSYGKISGIANAVSLQGGEISAAVEAPFTKLPQGNYRVEVRLAGADVADAPVLTIATLDLRRRYSATKKGWTRTVVIGGFLNPPAGAAALGATVVNHNSF